MDRLRAGCPHPPVTTYRGSIVRAGIGQTLCIVLLVGMLYGCGFVDSGVGGNLPPNQFDDSYGIAEGGDLAIPAPGILQNDFDGGNRALTARLRTGPSRAVAFQLNDDGSFTYTHDGSEATTDNFTYIASDGLEDSAPATVTLNVDPVNDPPTAGDDDHFFDEDTGVAVENVRTNDNDPDNDTTELNLVEVNGSSDTPVAGTWGTLSWNSDGSYEYSINAGVQSLKPGEFVQDAFTYTIQDPEQLAASANLIVTITGSNDAPTAVADSGYQVLEGASLTVTTTSGVLANDTDVESDNISAVLTSNPGNVSSFSLSANGGFTYQHNGGENTGDSFSYQAMDIHGARSAATTASITVVPVNDPPNAVNDGNSASAANLTIPVTGDMRANDSDPDNPRSSLVVSLVDGSSASPQTGSWVTLSWQANGSYSATLRPNVKSLKPGESVQDSFVYTLADPQSATDTATLTFTIFGVNDPPDAEDDTVSTNEDTAVNIDVLANDNDPDEDALTIQAVTQGTNGSVTNNGTSVTYQPNQNFNGNDTFTYTVTDSISGTDTATVTVTVNPQNDPPVAENDSAATVLATAITISVLANDTDPDTGDTLTVRTVTQGNFGSVTNNVTNVTYQPNFNFLGTDSFTYQTQDNSGAPSGFATVTVTVTLFRESPRTQSDSGFVSESSDTNSGAAAARGVAISANAGRTSGNVLANDTDDKDKREELIVAAFNGGSVSPVVGRFGTLLWSADGSYTYTVNNADPDTDALSAGNIGTDAFHYTVVDTDNNEAIGTLTVTVIGTNDPPAALSGCSTTPQERSLIGQLAASDVDTAALELAFRLAPGGVPSKGTVAIDADGRYDYTPHNPGERGKDQFVYEVEDDFGAVARGTETIIIHPKVMPLGDSLTVGIIDPTTDTPLSAQRGGYRLPLWEALLEDGYTIDFVGGAQDGKGIIGFDPDHEGHASYSAKQISNHVASWLDSNPADIVMLHLGSDSLAAGAIPSALEVEALLNQIDIWQNSAGGNPVKVLLARIVNQAPYEGAVTSYNDAISSMVTARGSDHVTLVDQELALSYPADLFDGFHPTSGGYANMAEAWREAITPYIDRCP